MGSALAYWHHVKGDSQLWEDKRLKSFLSVTGFILIIGGIFIIHPHRSFPGYWALLPVFGAALIIQSGPETLVNSKILSNKLLLLVGLINYPLYLWHWSILSFLYIFDGSFRQIPKGQVVVGLAASFLLAWWTYKYIEQPIRHGLYKQTKTIILSCAIGYTFIIGLIVLKNGNAFFPGCV